MNQPHQPDRDPGAAPSARNTADDFFRELEIQFLIHELKDPVSIIETGLRTLLERRDKFGPLTPKQENTLKRTLRNTKKTRSMLNNLLEIGRSQSGCFIGSHFQPTRSVMRIMKDALEIMTGPLAEEIGKYQAETEALALLSQNGIYFEISPGLADVEMFQDEIKFSQIVGNLFKNALHHRRHRIEINMAIENANLVLAVSDDGPGIEPEHQELIFKRYAQVNECSVVPRKGHGLGLAGALILARCLGGDIGIVSQKGRGALFRLTLPLKLDTQ